MAAPRSSSVPSDVTVTASRLSAVGAELGEGPIWHTERREVIWVDILRGEVHACGLDGVDRTEQVHEDPVGAVALTAGGEVLAATPRGLRRADGTVVAEIPRESVDLRMNDGKPGPDGRFVGGTMTIGEARQAAGSLWSVEGATDVTRLVADVTIPNGLAWSADGREFYWIDTPTGRVDAFDYDVATGAIANRRPLFEIDESVGAPDGMCIDSEGGLWIALWGGNAVRRYVNGVCEEIIELPTPFVTCPTFVGEKLDQLVITTASIEFDRRPPGAGDLYIADAGVVGSPPNRLGAWAG
jgi:sugar lactone lactonase YvrE